MPGLTSRARPHPYDAYFNRTPVKLKPDPQTGLLYAKKAISGANVVAQAYDYGAYSPFVEKPFVGGPFVGGMGEQVQSSASDPRYRRAENADLSIGGQRRIGPFFHPEQIATGQFVNFLGVGRHGGADTLFALVGRYVYRNTGGTWVLSRDSGGAQHLMGVQFQASSSTADRFWVTNDAGELWGYDGAVWAQATLPVGGYAQYVEKVGTQLIIGGGSGGGNQVRFLTPGADPMLAVSWGGPIYVGDYARHLTWIRQVENEPFFFKEDGIFTINGDGSVNDIVPELRETMGQRRGRNAAVFRSALWFAYGSSFFRMTADGTLTPVGPERMMDLDPALEGDPICFAAHGDWFGYLAVWTGRTDADLFKYGTWTNVGQVGASFNFADEWNGSITRWAGKQPTSIVTTDTVGSQPRLYVGFSDGSVAWCVLPSRSPDPADDHNCEFDEITPSRVYWPDHHAMAEADVKHWRGFVGNGPRMDAQNYLTVETSVDGGATWVPLDTAFTATGQRVNTSGSLATSVLRVREVLHGTRTSTPEIVSVDLLEQVRPSLILDYGCTVEAARNLVRRDGSVDRRTGEQIRAAMQAVADAPGPVTAEFIDETNHEIDAVDYGETQIPDSYGLAWDITLRLIDFKTNTVFGTWDRALGHNWDEAGGYSWDQTIGW